jgi:predicted Zn-dependent protease
MKHTNQSSIVLPLRAWAFTILGLVVGSSFFLGCSQVRVDQIANYSQSLFKVGQAVAKTFQDITPEQEYYIGRAVGAIVAGKYKPYQNQKSTFYLNVLGQTLAQASDRPETFGGYHFAILESDEINAFAAPGGLIFVSRGCSGAVKPRCGRSPRSRSAM